MDGVRHGFIAVMAQHAQEFQPLVIRRQPHAQPPARILRGGVPQRPRSPNPAPALGGFQGVLVDSPVSAMRSRSIGWVCTMTRPGPVTCVTKIPSPPNTRFLMPFWKAMS